MNRCPTCRGPLRFLGIETHPKNGWLHWETCDLCLTSVATTASGNIRQVTREEPKPTFFLRPPAEKWERAA